MSVWEAGGERGERAEAEGPAGDRGLTPGGRCRGSHVGSERRILSASQTQQQWGSITNETWWGEGAGSPPAPSPGCRGWGAARGHCGAGDAVRPLPWLPIAPRRESLPQTWRRDRRAWRAATPGPHPEAASLDRGWNRLGASRQWDSRVCRRPPRDPGQAPSGPSSHLSGKGRAGTSQCSGHTAISLA